MRHLIVIAVILLTLMAPAYSAPGYLGGYSGTILVPDGLNTPSGQWDVSFHDIFNLSHDRDLRATGIQYGLFPKLEVGVSFLEDGASKVAFNGKFRLLDETAALPVIAVGVFDVANTADFLSNSTSGYIIVSKNITTFASHVSNMPSKPLRLSIGAGTGVFNGLLASLDWTIEPKIALQAEYFGGHLADEDHMVNAGIRYAFSDSLRLDASVIDLKRIGIGASFRSSFK